MKALAFVLAFFLAACGGGAPSSSPSPVTQITLSPTELSNFYDYTAQLQAVSKDASGTTLSGQVLEWSSSDTTIATVDANGLVTLKQPGTAQIVAKSGSVQSQAASIRVQGFSPAYSVKRKENCAINEAGFEIFCWGEGYSYSYNRSEIGNSARAKRVSLGAIPVTAKIVHVEPEFANSCALTDTGEAYCWSGYEQTRGELLGAGSAAFSRLPVKVAQGDRPVGVTFNKVRVGSEASCGVGSDGKLYCWGKASQYPSVVTPSSPPFTFYSSPKLVSSGDIAISAKILDIAMGLNEVCVLIDTGKVHCQEGVAWKVLDHSAVPVTAKIVRLNIGGSANDGFTALADDGSGYTIASGFAELFGNGTTGFNSTFALRRLGQGDIPSGAKIIGISLGGISASGCAATDLGSIHCWGNNSNGATGNGTLTNSKIYQPTKIVQGELPLGVKYLDVQCGTYHCTAYASNKLFYTWGGGEGLALGRTNPNSGQLNSGFPLQILSPLLE
jgi:alpha-tubulin suppressor-like RCC1 family protein